MLDFFIDAVCGLVEECFFEMLAKGIERLANKPSAPCVQTVGILVKHAVNSLPCGYSE
jgi:hypothetical protein